MPLRLLQAKLFFFAATEIRIGRDTPLLLRLLQANYSSCRIDGVAAIPDFRPRLGNRCSYEVRFRDFLASILDFKPRLANRCSHKVKTGAIRASILDFKPRLANRCSQKVKTGAIHASILDFRPRLANRCSPGAYPGDIPARRQSRPHTVQTPQADSDAATRSLPSDSPPRRTTQKIPTHS